MRNLFHHCLRCQWAKSKDFSSFQNALKQTSFYQKWSEKFYEHFSLFGQLVVRNFHSVAAHQIRRTLKFGSFYRNVYGDGCFVQLFNKFGGSKLRNSKVKFCFAAVLFSWDKEKVSDKEINSTIEDMNAIEHIEHLHLKHPKYMESWEIVIDRDHLKVWRKPLPTSTYLYEYKVYGTFYDISAQSFFDIQVDLEYRKKWDKLVINLDIVDQDQESGSEVVHWVTHFPYPMYSRDYVYVRRSKVDPRNNCMVVVSRATDHPSCPEKKDVVRVTDFQSQMVIKPHKTFNENGLDYVLTYYDDPKSNYPSFAYNWMATKGLPSFVDTLHNAAKDRHKLSPAEQQLQHNTSINPMSSITQVNNG